MPVDWGRFTFFDTTSPHGAEVSLQKGRHSSMGTVRNFGERLGLLDTIDEARTGDLLLIQARGLLREPRESVFVTTYDGSLWVREEGFLFCLNNECDFVFQDTGLNISLEMEVVLCPSGNVYLYDRSLNRLHSGLTTIGELSMGEWAPSKRDVIWYLGEDDVGNRGLCRFLAATSQKNALFEHADSIVGVTEHTVYVTSQRLSRVFRLDVYGNVQKEFRYPLGVPHGAVYVTPEHRICFLREDCKGVVILDSDGAELCSVPEFTAESFVGTHNRGLWFEHDNMLGLLVL